MYTIKDRLTLLRRHLVGNWETADDWKLATYDRNGTPCLVAASTPPSFIGRDFIVGTSHSRTNRQMKEHLFGSPEISILDEFKAKGKEYILGCIDLALLRLEAPSKHTPFVVDYALAERKVLVEWSA